MITGTCNEGRESEAMQEEVNLEKEGQDLRIRERKRTILKTTEWYVVEMGDSFKFQYIYDITNKLKLYIYFSNLNGLKFGLR